MMLMSCLTFKRGVTMKQREAVFKATVESLAERGVNFIPGETIIHDHADANLRKSITDKLTTLFLEGAVDLKETASNQKKLQDPKELRKYIAGLITNWHNKDPQLNAGAKYEAKNPGSRTASGDDSIKEMKQLLKYLESTGDEEGAARVSQAIETRKQEIAAESPKSVASLPAIDPTKIPDFLKDLMNLTA